MIFVVPIGNHMFRVGGIEHGDGITARVLEAAIRGEQKRQAALFGREVTVRGPLKKNTPEYDAMKARRGFDTRRGHKSGKLQGVLDSRVLWSVRVIRKKGKEPYAVVQFVESRIIKAAPHYEHYRDSMEKTAENAGVLIATRRFATILQRVLRRVQMGLLAASAETAKQRGDAVLQEIEFEWRKFAV